MLPIVQAGKGDLDRLTPLFDAYRQFYGQPSDPAACRAFLGARLGAGESTVFLASTVAGEPVGFTQLYPSYSSISIKRLWILNDLFVARRHRGIGAATALLAHAQAFAASTGAKGLMLQTAVTNAAARRLYEGAGWRLDQDYLTYTCAVSTAP